MIYTQTVKSLLCMGSDQIAGVKYWLTAILGKLTAAQPLILNQRGDNIVSPLMLDKDYQPEAAQRENMAFKDESLCKRLLISSATKTLMLAQTDKKYYHEGEEVQICVKLENIHSKQAIDEINWNFTRKLKAISKSASVHEQSEVILSGISQAYCGSGQVEDFLLKIQTPILDQVDFSFMTTNLHNDESQLIHFLSPTVYGKTF